MADRETGTVTSLSTDGRGPGLQAGRRPGLGRPARSSNPAVAGATRSRQRSAAFSARRAQPELERPGQRRRRVGSSRRCTHDGGSITEFDRLQPCSSSQRRARATCPTPCSTRPAGRAAEPDRAVHDLRDFPAGVRLPPGGPGVQLRLRERAGRPSRTSRSDDYVAFHMGGDIQTRRLARATTSRSRRRRSRSSAAERDPGVVAGRHQPRLHPHQRRPAAARRLQRHARHPDDRQPARRASGRRRRRRRRAPTRRSGAGSRSPTGAPSSAPIIDLRRDLPRPAQRSTPGRRRSSPRAVDRQRRSGSSSRAWSGSASCSAAPRRGCAWSARCRSAPRSAGASASAGTAR